MVSISLKVAITQMVNIKKIVFFNSFGSLKKNSLSVQFYLQVLADSFDINKFSCYSPSELGK